MNIPKKNASELLKKSLQSSDQSKRTTLKLTSVASNTLSWITENFDYTTKQVFDEMAELDLYNTITKEGLSEIDRDDENAERKTYVMTHRTLKIINDSIKGTDISRDELMNCSILTFKDMLEKLLKQEKEREKEAHKLIEDLRSKAYEVEKEIKGLLHEDNPIIDRVGTIVIIADNLDLAIHEKLKNGTPIDPNDY